MRQKIIKLTTPWKHDFFYSQTPNGNGVFGDYKFEIDNDCNVCDYWVIWGGLNPGKESETVKCPKENLIFLTDEAHNDRFFLQDFLDQFFTVVTNRSDIKHENIIYHHELNTWHLKKTYDQLIENKDIVKTKTLCALSSDLTILKGHKERYAFVNKLIGHFKDKIDVYGRGFNSFDDKFEVLKEYKYSVTIENSFLPGYFTEKISECFLTHTLPLYWGCPDLENYFDKKSFIRLDINDYLKSIRTIEEIIEQGIYEERIEVIKQQKKTYLNSYNIFPALINLIEKHFKTISTKVAVKIKREPSFQNFYPIIKLLTIINNRSFVSEKYKFELNFRNKGKYSNK
ncbi:MAG: glycosyltransferase family 10 [Pelobium sp.]